MYGPLALRMEVDAAYRPLYLVETDIVEALKAGARDCPNAVIRDEEIFLPSHEHVLALGKIAVCEIGPFGLFGQWFPCRKPGPVVYVCFLIGAPCFIASYECVLGADDFSFEECGQGGMVFREACIGRTTVRMALYIGEKTEGMEEPTLNAQIATHIGLGHIHVLDLHVNIIHLAV